MRLVWGCEQVAVCCRGAIMAVQLPPMPASVAELPRDERGYPVPFFVAWLDDLGRPLPEQMPFGVGKPEFRTADPRKLVRCVRHQLCWICGQPLDMRKGCFVIGPMSVINRITSEPPSHRDCAEFAMAACPFLSRPKAVRREHDMPENSEPPGFYGHNPGTMAVYQCRGYIVEQHDDGILLSLPLPSGIWWYREGRRAERSEVIAAIEDARERLMPDALAEGQDAVADLESRYRTAMKISGVARR